MGRNTTECQTLGSVTGAEVPFCTSSRAAHRVDPDTREPLPTFDQACEGPHGADGHDDMRAALVYQRATSDAGRLIAERLSALVDAHHGRRSDADGEATRWPNPRTLHKRHPPP